MSGKAILFVAMMSWGPHYPDVPAKAMVLRYEKPSLEACEASVAHFAALGDGHMVGFAGKIGNLPGYRAVYRTWCEPADEPWPMFDIEGNRLP